MNESSTVYQQVETLRRQTIELLEVLMAKAEEFELAKPPDDLEWYRRKLRQNVYKVLVVGEAKRGKSTFVNALVGRDILPTDTRVATSQVFSIWPSQHEAYRLRFEDDSEQEISLEDIPLYGSQVMAEAGVIPPSDKIIRWIEVDTPIRFLPENMIILDTPGVGALYAVHAQITYRFVPEADAVIFVLESGQPVIEEDLKFIEEILTVTRNIFFIQTKIDLYSKEVWQDIQRRNQEILERRFEKRLADTRIWPVSSTLLRKAASADKRFEETYVMASRQEELMGALQTFLSRASGSGRAAGAVGVASRYHAATRKVLEGRLAGLTAESQQQRAELQRVAVETKQQFDAEWGLHGDKFRELREELQRTTDGGKQWFSWALQPGGDIDLAQWAKVDAIRSLDEANKVLEDMHDEVIKQAMNTWARVCSTVHDRCVALLGPFAEAVEDAGTPLDHEPDGITIPGGGLDDEFKRDYYMMLRGSLGGGMMLLGVSSMASLLGGSLTGMLAGTVAAAVAPYAAIPFIVAAVLGGGKVVLKQQLESAKKQLRAQFSSYLEQVRRYFFEPDLSASKYSLVDEYFMKLDRKVNETVQRMVEKKSSESQAEIARLTEAMQLDERERGDEVKRIREQLAEWDRIGKSVKDVMKRIKELEGARATSKG